MKYVLMTKHPDLGEIEIDVLDDKVLAYHLLEQKVYGDAWIEEIDNEDDN